MNSLFCLFFGWNKLAILSENSKFQIEETLCLQGPQIGEENRHLGYFLVCANDRYQLDWKMTVHKSNAVGLILY